MRKQAHSAYRLKNNNLTKYREQNINVLEQIFLQDTNNLLVSCTSFQDKTRKIKVKNKIFLSIFRFLDYSSSSPQDCIVVFLFILYVHPILFYLLSLHPIANC